MRIVTPYVNGMLNPLTNRFVTQIAGEESLCRIEKNDDTAYARMIIRMWDDREAFTIIEQDVVPDVDMISDLIACPKQWCGFSYTGRKEGLTHHLGLARFSVHLIESCPNLARDALLVGARRDHLASWRSCDALLARALGIHRVMWHHHGSVPHRAA